MKRLLLAAGALLASFSLFAQDDVLWIRHASISPDGNRIAFSWQGDIYTAGIAGGDAQRVTSNTAYDSDPLWTADGKKIIFSSYRELSKDIWIIDAKGGEPVRITDFPGAETPLFVTRTGAVVFSSDIQPNPAYSVFPVSTQTWQIQTDGTGLKVFSDIDMQNVTVNYNGIILYEDRKGYEDVYRKHHTSSVTRDIWEYMPRKNQYVRLTGFNGEDRNPVFASNGNDYYFLSERDGTFNVWKSSISSPEEYRQITSFEKHPVRNLTISANDVLAFTHNGSLYTCVPGTSPVKVTVNVRKDSNVRPVQKRRANSGIKAMSPSPNDEEIAVIMNGELFVISPDQHVTRRLTDTPEQERDCSFSADGRTIYFDSERDGEWGIYRISLANKDDRYFSFSYDFKEERVTKKGQTCFQPTVSPDGKWLAYLRNRSEIVVKDISNGKTNGKEKAYLKGALYSYTDGDLSFEWSPDSRHILTDYLGEGRWSGSDIAMIDVESGTVTDITKSGYDDYSFRWALDGKAMVWMSSRDGGNNVHMMFFDRKAMNNFNLSEDDEKIAKLLAKKEEKKPETKKDDSKKKNESKKAVKDSTAKADKFNPDLENLEDRIIRLTPVSGVSGRPYLSTDGKKLFYCQMGEKSSNLCCLDVKKGDVKVVKRGWRGWMLPSADGKSLYLMNGSSFEKYNIAGGTSKTISYNGEYEFRPAEEREYIFNHEWKQVSEKFYDVNIHGVDWKGMYDNYAQFLPYIDNDFDFNELLGELLGELNASHTGSRYRPAQGVKTGCLGAIFDMNYDKKGLKILEILPGSPLLDCEKEIKAGDVIIAVDGVEIKAGEQWYTAFTDKVGKRTMIKVQSAKPSKTFDVFVKPVSRGAQNAMLEERWIRSREEIVANLSGGRIGYVYVSAMNQDSYRSVYHKLFGKYRTCEAVIVDTRYNGGGNLHDQLATLLDGKRYIDITPRGDYFGSEPRRKWYKPSCVVVNEYCYSDAHIFPYVYQTLGIGKVIGAPVAGTGTAVWWETQVNPDLVFGIPEMTMVGVKEGKPLENSQLEPDIVVYNTPESILEGRDLQLEKAVEEMLKEIDGQK